MGQIYHKTSILFTQHSIMQCFVTLFWEQLTGKIIKEYVIQIYLCVHHLFKLWTHYFILSLASQWYLRNSLILSNQNGSQINNARSRDLFVMSGVSVFPVYVLSVYFGSIFFYTQCIIRGTYDNNGINEILFE